ncbi:MAG: beta-Ala-His dipeptidase [Candidatus Lokiarchaeota archaeon]|nr:beta-Ala-His dipeptidase [Candidatus Lokiarchaeota archaeon]
MVLEHFEPSHVWRIFEQVLTKTPRSSKKEEKIRGAVKNWLNQQKKNGAPLSITEDAIGNICIKKSASSGIENSPPILLQAHLDMVCETDRPGGFDFDSQPIPVRIQNNKEWVDADGTTLGADNGIGVALILGLLIDEKINHGPLEVLLTVDEETGLTGAFELDLQKHKIQSKYLINVDSEELGKITMGSAGGGDTIFTKKLRRTVPKNDGKRVFFELYVSGLRGGHSGGDIHRNRGNAHKIIARVMSNLLETVKCNLCTWEGGSKHNAIPRESTIVFAAKVEDTKNIERSLKDQKKQLEKYYKSISYRTQEAIEPNFTMKWKKIKIQSYISRANTNDIIATANMVHSGVIEFSPSMRNLTQTSNNFAIVRTSESKIEFIFSTRSSIDADLHAFRLVLLQLGKLAGWKVKQLGTYPGWIPDPSAEFLQFAKLQYEKTIGESVELKAVHGGLETGIIGAMIPGLQMISIGPSIQNPHTPAERLKIKDVAILYEVLKNIIQNLR